VLTILRKSPCGLAFILHSPHNHCGDIVVLSPDLTLRRSAKPAAGYVVVRSFISLPLEAPLTGTMLSLSGCIPKHERIMYSAPLLPKISTKRMRISPHVIYTPVPSCHHAIQHRNASPCLIINQSNKQSIAHIPLIKFLLDRRSCTQHLTHQPPQPAFRLLLRLCTLSVVVLPTAIALQLPKTRRCRARTAP